MAESFKNQIIQGRLTIGLVIIILILFKPPVFAKNVDDWADPLHDAQALLAKQQYKDALIAFKAQANLENGLAQFTVALFYDLGWGITPSRSTACQWYQKAARTGG
jgi:TPR repeat protein